MNTLYDAALLLRKAINNCRQFSRGAVCFFTWVINGPDTTLSAKEKCQEVHKSVMSLVQSTVSMRFTERQIGNKKSDVIKASLEMSEQWQWASQSTN